MGADFLRRRIAPLQKRDRFAWEYKNAADWMRLYPSVANNLTVMSHAWLCEQLFHKAGTSHLPARIVPLHINSAIDQILKWMPDCNANGVKADWQLPSLEDEMEWASSLEEKAIRKETDFTKGTTEEEQEYIRSRLEEARRLKAAGAAGDDDEDDGNSSDKERVDEEIAGLEAIGAAIAGAKATGSEAVEAEAAGAEGAEAPEEEEGLEVGPQAPEQRHRLRKRGSREPVVPSSSRARPKVKKTTDRGSKEDTARCHSARLTQVPTPPSRQRVVKGVDPTPPSSPVPAASRTPPPLKRARESPLPLVYEMDAMLDDPE